MQLKVSPREYTEDAINTATAYVEILMQTTILGVWLTSNVIDDRFPPQIVQAGDTAYELALRFRAPITHLELN